jgi:hypothetical protein
LAPHDRSAHLGGTTRKDKPMTDEILLRHWTAAHNEFSNDLSRGLLRLGHYLSGRLRRRETIGEAYAPAACTPAATDTGMSPTARAALAGVLACVATTALLVSVAALASAGAGNAPALHSTMAAGQPIMSHVILA